MQVLTKTITNNYFVGEALFSTAYFPTVSCFAAMIRAEKIIFEKHEHYVKQTFRNRTMIYSANGIQQLIIPVEHANLYRIPIHEVRIANDSNWHKIHWRSLESAYRKSPYFEYFESELKTSFEKPAENLFDFNLELTGKIFSMLRIPFTAEFTSAYEKLPENISDFRNSFAPDKINPGLPSYQQVFSDRHNFISDLSVLDLLFNKGMDAKEYLLKVRDFR
jgi:hypothetical protein